jgi:hypothetical protein
MHVRLLSTIVLHRLSQCRRLFVSASRRKRVAVPPDAAPTLPSPPVVSAGGAVGVGTSEAMSPTRVTPLQAQYHALKVQHPGHLLLFRIGGFYELFEEDARTASECLGIVLTQKHPGWAMCGFPHFALDTHLARLIVAGHVVAICEQTESPGQARARGASMLHREVFAMSTCLPSVTD